MLSIGIVRRVAWALADRGIFRERIEESFKRLMIVRPLSVHDGPDGVVLDMSGGHDPALREAGSAGH